HRRATGPRSNSRAIRDIATVQADFLRAVVSNASCAPQLHLLPSACVPSGGVLAVRLNRVAPLLVAGSSVAPSLHATPSAGSALFAPSRTCPRPSRPESV